MYILVFIMCKKLREVRNRDLLSYSSIWETNSPAQSEHSDRAAVPSQGTRQKAYTENSVGEKRKSLVLRQLLQFISLLQSAGKADTVAVAKAPALSCCPSSQEADREPL